MKELTGKDFSERSIKERVTLLVEKFEAKIKKDEYKSGTEEEVTEIDDLLHQKILLIEEFSKTKKIKSCFQKGYEKRELALDSTKQLPAQEVGNNGGNEVNQIHYEDVEQINAELSAAEQNVTQPILTTIGNTSKVTVTQGNKGGKNVRKTMGSVLTPTRQRNTGIKSTSIKFLEQKNDRWYEIRKRELDIEDKKFEFEKEERRRRLAIEEARLDLEQRRFAAEMDIFNNQQKIMDRQLKLMEILANNKNM